MIIRIKLQKLEFILKLKSHKIYIHKNLFTYSVGKRDWIGKRLNQKDIDEICSNYKERSFIIRPSLFQTVDGSTQTNKTLRES